MREVGEQRVAPSRLVDVARTWLLKSQYGQFDTQNGQWT